MFELVALRVLNCMSTHIDYDIKSVIIGQKDTDRAAVLHGFVVVEVQFVHLCVEGTGPAPNQGSEPSDDLPPPPQAATPPRSCCVPVSAGAQSRHSHTFGPSSTHKAGHGDPNCNLLLWKHNS